MCIDHKLGLKFILTGQVLCQGYLFQDEDFSGLRFSGTEVHCKPRKEDGQFLVITLAKLIPAKFGQGLLFIVCFMYKSKETHETDRDIVMNL